jgi:hypothetical protein
MTMRRKQVFRNANKLCQSSQIFVAPHQATQNGTHAKMPEARFAICFTMAVLDYETFEYVRIVQTFFGVLGLLLLNVTWCYLCSSLRSVETPLTSPWLPVRQLEVLCGPLWMTPSSYPPRRSQSRFVDRVCADSFVSNSPVDSQDRVSSTTCTARKMT